MSGVRAVSRLLRARRLALTRPVSRPRGRAGAGRAGTAGPHGQGRSGRRVPAPASVIGTVSGRPAGRSVEERGPPEGSGAVPGPAALCPKPAGLRLCEGHDPVRLRRPRSPGPGSRRSNAGRRPGFPRSRGQQRPVAAPGLGIPKRAWTLGRGGTAAAGAAWAGPSAYRLPDCPSDPRSSLVGRWGRRGPGWPVTGWGSGRRRPCLLRSEAG